MTGWVTRGLGWWGGVLGWTAALALERLDRVRRTLAERLDPTSSVARVDTGVRSIDVHAVEPDVGRWWVVREDALLDALRSAHAGESPDLVLLELDANKHSRAG